MSRQRAHSTNRSEHKTRPAKSRVPVNGRHDPQSGDRISAKTNANTDWIHWFASETARLSGRPLAFALAVALIVVWGVTGPLFGFSDTWQLVINTGTTIVTFLMVFLIQHTQNRDTLALQVKLAELIIAMHGAHNRLASAPAGAEPATPPEGTGDGSTEAGAVLALCLVMLAGGWIVLSLARSRAGRFQGLPLLHPKRPVGPRTVGRDRDPPSLSALCILRC